MDKEMKVGIWQTLALLLILVIGVLTYVKIPEKAICQCSQEIKEVPIFTREIVNNSFDCVVYNTTIVSKLSNLPTCIAPTKWQCQKNAGLNSKISEIEVICSDGTRRSWDCSTQDWK